MKTAEIYNKTVLIVEPQDLTYEPSKKGIRYPFSATYDLVHSTADHDRADVVLLINGGHVSVLKDKDHSAPEILKKTNYTKLLLKADAES